MQTQRGTAKNFSFFEREALQRGYAVSKKSPDYYPFGQVLPNRHYSENLYDYGFNGMRKDDEIKQSSGTSYTTEFRQYDPRIGRWLSLDPLGGQAPGWTPYRAFFNNPMLYTDQNGLYETKKQAREARKSAKKDGYYTGKIYGKEGHYVFNATKGEEFATFKNKYLITLNDNQVNYFNKFLPANKQFNIVDNWSILGLFMDTEHKFSESEYEKLVSGHLKHQLWEQSLPVGSRPSAQGSCTPCDGFWQSFIGFGVGSLSAKAVSNLVPLGLGSTGRTTAVNVMEQMAMKEVMSNPALGRVVMEGMNDARWLGWSKMQYSITSENGVKAVIHYVGKWENGVLKAVDDFKFK